MMMKVLEDLDMKMMTKVKMEVKAKAKAEREIGAALVEMALVVSLIAIVSVAGVRALGVGTGTAICRTYGGLAGAEIEGVSAINLDWEFEPDWEKKGRLIPCKTVERDGGWD